MFSQDFKEFVSLLNENNVSYLVVGGYAVGIHGHPRYTGDLDIWFLPETENVIKLLNVLELFGLGSMDISTEDLLMEGSIIQIGYPPLRIDLLNMIDGVNFTECFPNRKIIEMEELKIPFIGFADLIKNKIASGRHQDLGDIENLTLP